MPARDFKFYRIFCSTPPDLEPERRVFEAAVAQFVERVSMPDAVLFAAASLRPPIVARVQKLAIESNIRMCEFFVHIVGEQQPETVFQDFVEYALRCKADPAVVTRDLAILFRNYSAAVPEVRRFREALAARGGSELRDFSGTAELSDQIGGLLTAWYAPLKPGPA